MRKLLLIISIIFSGGGLYAQSGSTGFDILNSSPFPISLSLNDASTAYASGSASAYINPALLIMNSGSSIDIAYTDWVFDSNHFFAGLTLIDEKQAISFNIYNSVNDGFLQRDTPGAPNGTFGITYLSLGGAYAYDLGFLTAGMSAQYLYEEIFDQQASGYSVNLGVARSFLDSRLNVGASLLNMGEMNELNVTATRLPKTFRAGISGELFTYTHPKNPDLPFTFTLNTDFVSPLAETDNLGSNFLDQDDYFSFGLVVGIAETIALSSGYRSSDSVRPYSFGIGILTEEINVNYAIIPFNTGYGTVHSIGMQYKF